MDGGGGGQMSRSAPPTHREHALPVSRRGFIGAALAASTTLPSRGARAAYPERPVRLIVPFAAGGAVDSVARVLGKALSANLGGAIVIHNRGGPARGLRLGAGAPRAPP